jgi:hypothetical protein
MTRKRVSETDAAVSSGASAVPSRRKAPARSRAKHTPVADSADAQIEIDALAGATPVSNASAVPASTAAAPAVYEPNHEEIALLAFLYWESRGGQGGSAEEDWLRAEQELRVRAAAVVA